MDDIIIKKGTDVVLNRDLNVREVTVARKGLKVACEKDIMPEPKSTILILGRTLTTDLNGTVLRCFDT